MLIVTPNGGHLGWVAGGEAPLGAPWTDPIVMDFLEFLEHPTSSSGVCSQTQEDVNSAGVTRDCHHLEV